MPGPCAPLLLGLLALTLPAPGEAVEVRADLETGSPWSVELAPSAEATWVLVELQGDDRADLDLEAGVPDALLRRAASHRSQERLVLEVPAGAPLKVAVGARHAAGERAFAVTFTTLRRAEPLAPGPARRVASQGARAELVPLAAPPGCLRLSLSPVEGDADLLVLDRAHEVLAACVGPGQERTALDPGPQAVAVVLLAPGTRGYSLRLEADPALSPAPLDRFLEELASTPDQRRALEVLRHHPDWVAIRGYLDRYPDGAPLELRTVPGLRARGVERFGGYASGVLAINPTIAGHQDNVQELVDTLVHELVHALMALPRVEPFPLAADVFDSTHDPALAELVGRTIRRGNVPERLAVYLEREYGPSASDPRRDWSDINAGAQQLVGKVVEDNLARTGVGRETLVFQNIRRREAGK